MARKPPLWQAALTYPAQVDRSLLASLWPQGGVSGGVVTAVNNTMTVSVAPGSAAVPLATGQGDALCSWDAPEIVTIAAAPGSGTSRIDLVVAQVRDPDLDGGANNDFVMAAVTGTPAASNPAVPATPANALVLYQITVPGAAANLNTATLTDMRGLRLSLPGMYGYAENSADQAMPNNGLPSNVTGLTMTFALPAPRRVLVAANVMVQHDGSANAMSFVRLADLVTVLGQRGTFLNMSFTGILHIERMVTLAAGGHTIYLQAWTSLGVLTVYGASPQQGWIRCTDAGTP
jgi:hypothetical protein